MLLAAVLAATILTAKAAPHAATKPVVPVTQATPAAYVFPEVPAAVTAAYPDAAAYELEIAWKGSRGIFTRHYEETLALLQDYEKHHPESLMGPLGRMFLYHMYMLEDFDFRFANQFDAAERACNALIKRQDLKQSRNPWTLLMVGGAMGMSSSMDARQQKYLPAFTAGMRAVNVLERAQDLKAGGLPLYDVNYGLGTYHYFASWAQKRSMVMAFMPDRRAQGLNELDLCARAAPITKPVCGYTVAYLQAQEGRYAEALARIEPLHAEYPENMQVRSLYGRLLATQRKPEEGLVVLEQILSENPGYSLTGYFIAQILHRAKREPDRVETLMKTFLARADFPKKSYYRSAAQLTLAEREKDRGQLTAARSWFSQIDPGDLAPVDRARYIRLRRELKP